MSAWLGRRDGLSHGEAERSTNSSSFRPQAHASVSVNVHRQTLNGPMFAQMNRTCCWPTIAEWIEPNVQIENVVYGRGKARNSARTSVTGIGYAMTHYPVQALAAAGQG